MIQRTQWSGFQGIRQRLKTLLGTQVIFGSEVPGLEKLGTTSSSTEQHRTSNKVCHIFDPPIQPVEEYICSS
jgi:hypothetical protein